MFRQRAYEVKYFDRADMIHYRVCDTWKEVRAVIEQAPYGQDTILTVRNRQTWQLIPRELWGSTEEPV